VLAVAKAEKAFKNQLNQIGSIKKQVDAFQAGQAVDLAARKEFEEEKAATLPKRLGKMKYQAPLTDVLMTSEVPDSLRSLPAAPTLLRSLYNGMQARNLIEPRLPTKKAGKRRYKIKEFNKRGFSSTTTVKSIENQFEDQAFSAKVSTKKKPKPNYAVSTLSHLQ
jgi:nucleolar protein 53